MKDESRTKGQQVLRLGNIEVAPGHSSIGELPVSKLVTGTQISIPVQIFHGKNPGLTIWLSAAVHGDEIAGVEIIRKITGGLNPRKMNGTVIAVPIVNVHGFLNGDRYLPDRRDLNRCFPGSATGSLAARIAHLFMTEIVQRCDVGIDLHTGSDNRTNLPQIRTNLDNPEMLHLAEVFGAPVVLHAKVRDGSLRGAASEVGAKVLLYEGGEANRFDYRAISAGITGIWRLLSELNIIDEAIEAPEERSITSRKSTWLRARRSGIAILDSGLGDRVVNGQQLGIIYDSVGKRLSRIISSKEGIIIGQIQHPLVNQGDALIHIAEVLI